MPTNSTSRTRCRPSRRPARQGAFLLWNHPGYPDRKSDIYPVHERLIAQGQTPRRRGVQQDRILSPRIDYAVQYGLVPFANSDIHYMSGSIYPVRGSRPMTLVFATARTARGDPRSTPRRAGPWPASTAT